MTRDIIERLMCSWLPVLLQNDIMLLQLHNHHSELVHVSQVRLNNLQIFSFFFLSLQWCNSSTLFWNPLISAVVWWLVVFTNAKIMSTVYITVIDPCLVFQFCFPAVLSGLNSELVFQRCRQWNRHQTSLECNHQCCSPPHMLPHLKQNSKWKLNVTRAITDNA